MKTITTPNGTNLLMPSLVDLVLAIDYDDTLSIHPDMWRQIIPIFRQFGFKIYIVTYRTNAGRDPYWGFMVNNSDMDWAIELADHVVFTGGVSKRQYCARHDIFPDIWIDDTPEAIVFTGCHDAKVQKIIDTVNL